VGTAWQTNALMVAGNASGASNFGNVCSIIRYHRRAISNFQATRARRSAKARILQAPKQSPPNRVGIRKFDNAPDNTNADQHDTAPDWQKERNLQINGAHSRPALKKRWH